MPDTQSNQVPAATVALVRSSVRDLLARSPGYRALPPDAQRRLADSMVRVGTFLAAPDGFPANELPGALTAVARHPVDAAGQVVAGAVDFPSFVAGLIQGTFDAILSATIQQMNAYSELLDSVAASVDRFVHDTVSDNEARDWLAAGHPLLFERAPGAPALRLKSGHNPAEALLGLAHARAGAASSSTGDVDGAAVLGARRRIATSRQQILATMVLMGINRIVVTDGIIRAKLAVPGLGSPFP